MRALASNCAGGMGRRLLSGGEAVRAGAAGEDDPSPDGGSIGDVVPVAVAGAPLVVGAGAWD